MSKYLIILIVIFSLCACGKSESTQTPQQKAYKSFKAQIDKDFPGTKYQYDDTNHRCDYKKMDVVETNSGANPLVGIINGAGGNESEMGIVIGFTMKFYPKDGEWVCSDSDSEAVASVADTQQPINDPCTVLSMYCTGKKE